MTKAKIPFFFFLVCIFLLIGFSIRLTADYIHYNETFSAPFSVFILIRGLEFLLPAAILLVIGLILRKKQQNKEDT